MDENERKQTEAMPKGPDSSSERSYIAFISYRHTPLDREAAELVQKKIENYIVPKEFRDQAGGRKLGVCFRDEDELEASSSLTDSIYYALDHTKFLIVICTPDLPLSKWCEAEIKYFLKTHDRDHILAVLADGTPDVSFSSYMLHEFDEKGNITGSLEPLAANIAGENHTINKKAFNKEIVRLYAAMIGCPFDALWQRERRAKQKRRAAALAAAFAVMAVFLGVVLNRNAQISAANAQITAQNDQIIAQNDELTAKNDEIQKQNDKIEEQNTSLQSQLSTVLVDSGIQKLENHDIKGALQDALAALESSDPKVYDHRAEQLLSDALGVYKTGRLQTRLVYQQTTDIQDVQITQDERFAILSDTVGTIRCLDLTTFEVVWEYLVKDISAGVYTKTASGNVLIKKADQVVCLSASDGTVLWTYEQDSPNYCQCISEDGSLFAVLDTKAGEEGALSSGGSANDLFRPVYAVFLDTESGHEMGRSTLAFDSFGIQTLTDAFKPQNYGTAFSSDNQSFFLSLYADAMDGADASSGQLSCFRIDTKTLECLPIGALEASPEDAQCLSNIYYGSVISNGAKEILFSCYDRSREMIRFVSLEKSGEEYECGTCDYGFSYSIESVEINKYETILSDTVPALFSESHMIVFADHAILFFDRQTKTVMSDHSMESPIRSAFWNDFDGARLLVTVPESGILYIWRMHNGELLHLRTVLDINDLLFSVPLNEGLVWNMADGSFLSVQTKNSGNLYQTRYNSDPSGSISVPYCGSSQDNCQDTIPGERMGLMLLYATTDSPLAVLFDRSTGEYTSDLYDLPNALTYWPVYMVDKDHFIQQNQLYSLKEGTCSPFVEFPERTEKAYPMDTFNTVRLSDGRLMTSGVGLYESQPDQYLLYYPVWIDGEYARFADDKLVSNYLEYNTWYPNLGKTGLFMDYGEHISSEGTAEPGFLVTSLISEHTWNIPNPFPEEINFIPALSAKADQMAVLYESGELCLFDLSKEDPLTVIHEESGAFGAMNETIGLCFSDGDDYLISLTSAGIIRIFDLNTQKLHSFASETFRDYTHNIDDEIRATFGVIQFLCADVSDDGSSLYISCSFASTPGPLMIIDTESWTIRSESEQCYVPDLEYNRIYSFTNNFDGDGGYGIISYPIHTLEDLKEWAKEVLENG